MSKHLFRGSDDGSMEEGGELQIFTSQSMGTEVTTGRHEEDR